MKKKFAILRNEDPYEHKPWVIACEKFKDKINYKIIDITTYNWLEKISEFKPDLCLLKPSGKTSIFRLLYQERVDILFNELGYSVFPSFEELKIYENKRYFAYWEKVNNIPHPRTYIFYHKKEAFKLLKKNIYPIVGKLNVGASGNGVKILRDKIELKKYISKGFSCGLKARTGPKLEKGHLFSRVWNKLMNPGELKNKFKTYKQISLDRQRGFLILQHYIPHDFEWRVVRIGNSFFAHKKLKLKEKASGSLLKKYDNPPLSLLNFVKEMTDRFRFYSVAVDIFESSPQKKYLVNEIQCIFGQSDPYQMLVDGKEGRYIYSDGKWIFEQGQFNTNKSYDLRLQYIISQFQK